MYLWVPRGRAVLDRRGFSVHNGQQPFATVCSEGLFAVSSTITVPVWEASKRVAFGGFTSPGISFPVWLAQGFRRVVHRKNVKVADSIR